MKSLILFDASLLKLDNNPRYIKKYPPALRISIMTKNSDMYFLNFINVI